MGALSPLLFGADSVGAVSQWGEVKKKHVDRSKPKAKDVQPPQPDSTPSAPRAARGRGGADTRSRGRGDRSRGGRGGRAGAHVNGHRAERPTYPSQPVDSWSTPAEEPTPAPPPKPKTEGHKNWASLFAPPPPPSPKKPAPPPAQEPPKPAEQPPPTTEEQKPAEDHEPEPQPSAEEPTKEEPQELQEGPTEPDKQPSIEEELTEKNVEKLPDSSTPQQSDTVASTRGTETPAASSQRRGQAPVPVPTFNSTPTHKYIPHRRVLEQQAAVVMPGNHAVDHAAVQFGSMGLNGSPDEPDIDEERETAETRTQPPQHSPAVPRAYLPPSSTQAPAQAPELVTVPRPAPGLPPAPVTTEPSFSDFGRFGEQKFDPFSQQVEQPHIPAQEPFSHQTPLPAQPPVVTTAADYGLYAADHTRNPYYYPGPYAQDAVSQGAAARFGATGADIQSQGATAPPSRYGHVDATSSGQNTPNPSLPSMVQPSQQIPHTQGYPYGYPYYSTMPPYTNYMSQMTQQHQYGRSRPMYDDARRYEDYLHSSGFGYGTGYGPYAAKGGMYGQPAFSYDHHPAASPAFAQATTTPAGRDPYGRTGSTQPTEPQPTPGHHAFVAGIPDVFGRQGFGPQPMGGAPQPGTGPGTGGPGDDPTGASASKGAPGGGPSPSLAHNRPGSAANVPTGPGSGAGGPHGHHGHHGGAHQGIPAGPAGLAPMMPNPQAMAFGSYPLTPQQYGAVATGAGGVGGAGGIGGLGPATAAAAAGQSHAGAGAYGSYGGFGGYYGHTGRGGGWGGNYGH